MSGVSYFLSPNAVIIKGSAFTEGWNRIEALPSFSSMGIDESTTDKAVRHQQLAITLVKDFSFFLSFCLRISRLSRISAFLLSQRISRSVHRGSTRNRFGTTQLMDGSMVWTVDGRNPQNVAHVRKGGLKVTCFLLAD